MNIFTRIGVWVEKHFPEKMTAGDVAVKFSSFETMLAEIDKATTQGEAELKSMLLLINSTVSELAKTNQEMSKVSSEINALKSQLSIKSRVAGSGPINVAPFASRLPPVQPANSTPVSAPNGNQRPV